MPGALDSGCGVFAFGCGDFFERGDRHPGLSGKGFGSRARLPIRESGFPGRAGELLLHILLLGQQAFDTNRETPRGGIAGHRRACGQQTLAGEQRFDTASKFCFGGSDHAGRNLFEPNLQ